jgi:NhaP-type Na+/H+ and K+/H+ antiporter
VADLVRGLGAYASFGPVVLQVFFISLVILDPIVVVLVALARPSGVWLGLIVMAVDMPANVFVNWPMLRQDWWSLVRPAGMLPLTLFTVFVLVSAVPLSRRLSASRSAT